MAYLIVHFREKSTPDGEQVYFALSRDGFHWEEVNHGQPVLWAYYGDRGVRDHTIYRLKDGRFVILSTDLSLSYGMRGKYNHSWDEVSRNGSKCLSVWESTDLVNWSEQRLQPMGDDFGCVWAPDIFFDPETDDYVVHWSSSHRAEDYRGKCIWCAHTTDFRSFSEPKPLFVSPAGECIDSAEYQGDDGRWYLFLRDGSSPVVNRLLVSNDPEGPFTFVEAFDESMKVLELSRWEAPTAYRLPDGRWVLFLDYFGVRGAGQGYRPFISDDLASGRFERADELFTFPYRFKHGTVLQISDEEYERVKAAEWEQ